MENNNRRLVLGFIFIIVGAIFLLQNLNIFDFTIPRYLYRWEMILIIIGTVNIFLKKYSAAFILIGIGTFFWIIEDYRISIWDLWPIILIIIGLSFIIKQGIFNSEKKKMTEE